MHKYWLTAKRTESAQEKKINMMLMGLLGRKTSAQTNRSAKQTCSKQQFFFILQRKQVLIFHVIRMLSAALVLVFFNMMSSPEILPSMQSVNG